MSEVKISAAEVNKLRQATGAGMMDCKKALVEAGGDFDKAIDVLRKKGQKVAEKRAEEQESQGDAFEAFLLSADCPKLSQDETASLVALFD